MIQSFYAITTKLTITTDVIKPGLKDIEQALVYDSIILLLNKFQEFFSYFVLAQPRNVFTIYVKCPFADLQGCDFKPLCTEARKENMGIIHSARLSNPRRKV